MRTGNFRRVMLAALLAAGAVASPASAKQAVPPTITNQGRLFDAVSNPVTGTLNVVFAIYDSPTATAPIWSEQHSIAFDEGFYSVTLGEMVPLDTATVFDGTVRYFGITVGTDPELSPRAPIQSVPYAFYAGDVTGDIHPSTVSIGSMPVIDNTGAWIGKPDRKSVV